VPGIALCLIFQCLRCCWFQFALQSAVVEAANLLIFDASKFVIMIPLPEETLYHDKRRLSAQFSEIAPKVINYDPEKPIRVHPDSPTPLARLSRLMLSTMSDVRHSFASNAHAVQPLKVIYVLNFPLLLVDSAATQLLQIRTVVSLTCYIR